MSDLVTFLLAQLDADEAAARMEFERDRLTPANERPPLVAAGAGVSVSGRRMGDNMGDRPTP